MAAAAGSASPFGADFLSLDLVPKHLDLTWDLGGTYVTPLSEIGLTEMPSVNDKMCNPYQIHGLDGCLVLFQAVALFRREGGYNIEPSTFLTVKEGLDYKLMGEIPLLVDFFMKKSPQLGTNVLVTSDLEMVFVPMEKDGRGHNMQLKLVEDVPESFSIYTHEDEDFFIFKDSNGTFYHLTFLPREVRSDFENI